VRERERDREGQRERQKTRDRHQTKSQTQTNSCTQGHSKDRCLLKMKSRAYDISGHEKQVAQV